MADNILKNFIYDTETNTSTCTLCNKDFKGKKNFNLKRHFEGCSQNLKKEKEINQSIAGTVLSIRTNVTIRKILESCLSIVAVNGKPLADLNTSGFSRLFEPVIFCNFLKKLNIFIKLFFYSQYANALKISGLSITHRNIHSYIRATADVIRTKISEEMKNELFCMMVDIATKNKKSILGVNIQCVINDEIVIRTISMDEITERHTSDNICTKLIKTLLPKYDFEPDQVYAFCADNAYNMKKAGELIDNEASDSIEEENFADFVATALETESDELGPDRFETAQFIPEEEFEDAILNMMRDCDFYADLISNVATKYVERNKDIHIKSTNTIGCASHTLHLGVEDGIKDTPSAKTVIKLARDLAKKLRTPTILSRLRAAGQNLPEIDVPTRWNSKYTMVSQL